MLSARLMLLAARISSDLVVSPVRKGPSASAARTAAAALGLRTSLAVLALTATLPGCSLVGQMFGRGVRECEGFDVPLSVFTGTTRKELRSRVIASGVDETYPFVVEANPQSLVIVGFTPLGTKSFTLERTGDEVKVDKLIGGALKIPPRNVMADVLAMSLPSACATTPEGAAPAAAFDHWQVTDTCTNSRPQKRTIAKSETSDNVEIEVEYRPEAIVVRQKRCGYIANYVLQASAPIPGVDVKNVEAPEEPAKAGTPAAAVTPAPVATPAGAVTPAPASTPAPAAKPGSAAKPAPAATPASEVKPAPAATPASEVKPAPVAAPATDKPVAPAKPPANEKPAAAKPAAPAIIKP